MSMPAGWYDDGSGRQRWWDGAAWTEHFAPEEAPPASPSQQGGPQYPPPNVAPPTYPQPGQPIAYVLPPAAVSPKSYTAAWLLSLFLGVFAVDRFYLGNIGLGVAKLLVGWLTGGIWWLVDFIVIVSKNAHDGRGLPVVWN